MKIGIDLVRIDKIKKVFEGGKPLQETVFTPQELCYSRVRRDPYIYLAACFAAKEAFLKALGTGFSGEMDWREIELQRNGVSAVPTLLLAGKTAQLAREMGVARYYVSLSSSRGEFVMAFVLLVDV